MKPMWWPFGKRTVKDGQGRDLRIPKRLKRWVALSPELYNTCLALGPSKKAVGVALTQKTTLPNHLVSVGTVKQLDLQALKKLKPQLILSDTAQNDPEQIKSLVDAGFVVAMFDIRQVTDAAQALPLIEDMLQGAGAKDMALTLEALGQRYSGGPRAAGLVGKGPFRVAGIKTLYGDLLRISGCSLVPNGPEIQYAKLELEEFTSLNPQIIFMFQKTYPFRDKDRLDLSMHEDIPAGKLGQIHILPPDIPKDYGPGLLAAVQDIRARIKKAGGQ